MPENDNSPPLSPSYIAFVAVIAGHLKDAWIHTMIDNREFIRSVPHDDDFISMSRYLVKNSNIAIQQP